MADPVTRVNFELPSGRWESEGMQKLSLARTKEVHRLFVFMMSWLVFMGGFTTLAIVYILRPIPNWWLAEPGWIDVVVVFVLQVAAWLWFFVWFESMRPGEVRLTSAGIALCTNRGRTTTLRWEDPKFAITVRVNRVSTRAPRASIVWGGRLIPGTGVSEESARAVLDAARMHRLNVEDSEVGWGRWRMRFSRIRAR